MRTFDMKNVRKQVDVTPWEIMSKNVEFQIDREIHYIVATRIRDPIWVSIHSIWELLHDSYCSFNEIYPTKLGSFGLGNEAWRRVYFIRSGPVV